MKLLAIETSSAVGSVALALDGLVEERTIPVPREQTRLLLPLIDELLGTAGLGPDALNAVVFGRGPGSFTGLRVAAAVAQGLATGAGLALVPVSSLAALAQGAWGALGLERALVGVDARMGEIYWAAYAVRNGMAELVGHEALSAPEALRAPWTEPWAAVGNAFAVHREALEACVREAASVSADRLPAARDLLPLAERELAAGRQVTPAEALPVYLREASAWRRSG